MNNNYKFLFNYFKTKKSISIDNLERNTNIFKIKNSDKVSILKKYDYDIKLYIETNNLSKNDLKIIEKDEILKKISDDYYNINEQHIELFFKEFINLKSIIIFNIKNIELFLYNKEEFNINNYNDNLFFINPINSKNSKLFFIHSFLSNVNTELYENQKEVETIIDVLIQGDVINLSLPSIGPISNYLVKDNKNFVDFISFFVSNKNQNADITSELPFNSIKIETVISDFLLDISVNKIYNNNFEEDEIKNLIENMIKGINIELESIYYLTNKKINNEYIIPYNIYKNDEINKITKNDLDKIKNIKDLITHNNKLFLFVTNNNSENNLKNKNFTNVLACYLFYVINIIGKILEQYVTKIDNILQEILTSKKKMFGLLNIEKAFQYTSDLKNSVLKFKYILFNNFHGMFLPSKITAGNYGMKIDDNKCYVPESIFLESNKNILNSYPFKKNSEYTTILELQNIGIDYDKLKNFITVIKDRNDIYKSNIKLEFGAFLFNKNLVKKAIKILSKNYNILLKNNKFYLFIINCVLNYFKDKNIPYEFIQDIEIFKSIMSKSTLVNYERNELEKKLLKKFELNIEKSTNYYLQLMKINKEIDLRKDGDIENLINLRDKFLLSFKAYFIKAKAIIIISENTITDVKLKNSLLKKYSEIKIIYEKKIFENN